MTMNVYNKKYVLFVKAIVTEVLQTTVQLILF